MHCYFTLTTKYQRWKWWFLSAIGGMKFIGFFLLSFSLVGIWFWIMLYQGNYLDSACQFQISSELLWRSILHSYDSGNCFMNFTIILEDIHHKSAISWTSFCCLCLGLMSSLGYNPSVCHQRVILLFKTQRMVEIMF